MGILLLVGGLASIMAAIVLVVLALRRENPSATGVASGLAAIESVYAGKAVTSAGTSALDRLMAPVSHQLLGLAQRLSPNNVVSTMQHRLDMAGNPGGWTAERILAYKGLGLVACGLAFGAVGLTGSVINCLIFGLVGALIGFFLPDLLLYNAGLRRQEMITAALPDILDLLCVSVEAGLGFDAALHRVARNTTGPLAGELARVLQEMQIGKSREGALKALAGRTSVEELRSFVSALVQASDLGIPIGKVLREQAKEMRIKRRQRAEEKAQKIPVKITVPVIFCILPTLFISVIGPGVISISRSFGAH
ncbi:MAG: type secretion system protein [Actinomycetia bacterium]|nr:type secretion system protein [Actinomycetes bacterium]